MWLALGLTAALAARATAAAPARERCETGARFAAKGDLPRAALYLDGCDELPDFERTAHEVHQKLEHSTLSTLDIETTPAGLVAEVDALPGEHVTTPATVWVHAGRHEVRVARDGGPPLVATVEVKPHAHATVVLEAPKAPPPPHAGHVDFGEEAAGNVQAAGAPPAVKHPPMLDCKYTRSCAGSGEQIDDPLAVRAEAPPAYPARAIELRAGAGENNKGLEPSVALVGRWRMPWQDPRAVHPWLWGIRADWSQQAGAVNVSSADELLKVLAAPDTAWLSLGTAFRYSTYWGIEGAAMLELALRRLPVSVSAQYQQGIEDTDARAFVLELGARY